MGEFHQSNRVISEKYLSELRGYVTNLIRPEDFSDPKTTDPQKFYLDFKNRIAPLVNTETQRLKDSLTQTGNCHLLLLNNTTLVDTVLQAAFNAAIWLYSHTQQKQLLAKSAPIAIIASWGYGRKETYFRSDITVQIISKSALTNNEAKKAEQLVKYLEYLFIHQDIFQNTASACYIEHDLLEKQFNASKLTDLFPLLESRLVAGNSNIYSEFMSTVKTA